MTETFLFKPRDPSKTLISNMVPGCVELETVIIPDHLLHVVELAIGAEVTLARDIAPMALVWTAGKEMLLMVPAADLEACV